MGYNLFGPGMALDKVTMRGLRAVAAQLEDAETGEPVQSYSLDSSPAPMAVVTNMFGYFPQFQVPDTVRRLRMRFGTLTLENTAWEVILEAGAAAEASLSAAEAAAQGAVAAKAAAEQAASLVEAPADTVIATTIANPDSETRTALDGQFLGVQAATESFVSRAVPQSLYQLAYRKSVHLHIPFKFPGWAAAMSTYGGAQGYVYPQAFNVDEQTNQLFISCPGDGYQVIVVRDWITGAFISYFAIQTTLTSEGLEIVYKGTQRLLYLRTYNNNMGQYDITTLPANGAVVTGSMVPLQSGMDFTRHNGVWTSNAITPPMGQYSPRGNMMRFTDDFTFLDGLNFGSIELGPWYGAPYDAYASELPKMQGICDAGGYYVVQMGAYASRGDRSRYGHIGLKVFDYQGNIAVTALMDQAKFLDILEQNGIGSSRSEGEGVQLVHGKLYSLTVTSTYNAANADTEGILFLREFSDEPNAIDFMPAALTFSTPNVESLASGLFPRTNGALRDPITGEAFSTLNQIITYMFATSQPRMAWYSSAVSVTDLAGASIPTGLLVEVYNRNNDSASMTWRGTRDYTWTIYKSGGTYMQQLASPVARGTDGNYELSVNASGAVIATKI